jgi:hypothetical protein
MRLHLEETRQQAERLEQWLDRMGEGSSTLTDAGGKLIAMGQSISGIFAGDERVRWPATFDYMEIASYKMLIAAAGEVGDAGPECVRTKPARGRGNGRLGWKANSARSPPSSSAATNGMPMARTMTCRGAAAICAHERAVAPQPWGNAEPLHLLRAGSLF